MREFSQLPPVLEDRSAVLVPADAAFRAQIPARLRSLARDVEGYFAVTGGQPPPGCLNRR